MLPRVTLAALLALTGLACAPGSGEPAADLLFEGGMLLDGSGAPARRADVAVRDGRIAALGDLGGRDAVRRIDVRGRTIAPGFVDMHSHADLILLAPPRQRDALLAAKIAQGVTTVIVGNCGLGVAPANDDAAAVLAGVNGWMTPADSAVGALSFAEYLERLQRSSPPLNVSALVPHGPLRISAMGLAPGEPSPAQFESMRSELVRSLDAGGLGLSVGLIYPPGMYSDTGELTVLAREVAAVGGLFTAHVRGSSQTLLPATRELLRIARESGARVHHSHLEAVGEAYWADVARVLALEDAARAEGLAVSHDLFLYTRAATMMSAIFPPWSLEGGVPALLDRLADPVARERIRDDIARRVPSWPPWVEGGWPHNLVGAVGWDGIRVASVAPGGPVDVVGRTLEAIAREAGRDPFDAVAELMLSQRGQVGQLVGEISGDGERTDVLWSILQHPAAAIVSDAEDYGRGVPHPAHAGAFARALRLNREHALLPPEELVRRMTSYPAGLVGLPDRGIIRVGSPADLVVFDPVVVADRAGWDAPRARAVGIDWVLINGRPAVEAGNFRGGGAGRVLRRGES